MNNATVLLVSCFRRWLSHYTAILPRRRSRHRERVAIWRVATILTCQRPGDSQAAGTPARLLGMSSVLLRGALPNVGGIIFLSRKSRPDGTSGPREGGTTAMNNDRIPDAPPQADQPDAGMAADDGELSGLCAVFTEAERDCFNQWCALIDGHRRPDWDAVVASQVCA